MLVRAPTGSACRVRSAFRLRHVARCRLFDGRGASSRARAGFPRDATAQAPPAAGLRACERARRRCTGSARCASQRDTSTLFRCCAAARASVRDRTRPGRRRVLTNAVRSSSSFPVPMNQRACGRLRRPVSNASASMSAERTSSPNSSYFLVFVELRKLDVHEHRALSGIRSVKKQLHHRDCRSASRIARHGSMNCST